MPISNRPKTHLLGSRCVRGNGRREARTNRKLSSTIFRAVSSLAYILRLSSPPSRFTLSPTTKDHFVSSIAVEEGGRRKAVHLLRSNGPGRSIPYFVLAPPNPVRW